MGLDRERACRYYCSLNEACIAGGAKETLELIYGRFEPFPTHYGRIQKDMLNDLFELTVQDVVEAQGVGENQQRELFNGLDSNIRRLLVPSGLMNGVNRFKGGMIRRCTIQGLGDKGICYSFRNKMVGEQVIAWDKIKAALSI